MLLFGGQHLKALVNLSLWGMFLAPTRRLVPLAGGDVPGIVGGTPAREDGEKQDLRIGLLGADEADQMFDAHCDLFRIGTVGRIVVRADENRDRFRAKSVQRAVLGHPDGVRHLVAGAAEVGDAEPVREGDPAFGTL